MLHRRAAFFAAAPFLSAACSAAQPLPFEPPPRSWSEPVPGPPLSVWSPDPLVIEALGAVEEPERVRCVAARLDAESRVWGWGPVHPWRAEADDVASACADLATVYTRDCERLEHARIEQHEAGRGERHPDVLALDGLSADCMTIAVPSAEPRAL